MIEDALQLMAQTSPKDIAQVLWTELILMAMVVMSMAGSSVLLFRRMAKTMELRVDDLKQRIQALENALHRSESERDARTDQLIQNQEYIIRLHVEGQAPKAPQPIRRRKPAPKEGTP